MQKPDFLITGAAGWIGKRLTRLLYTGTWEHKTLQRAIPSRPRVRCLVLPSDASEELRAMGSDVEVCEGDLRRKEDCIRFCEGAGEAVLIHTAGVIHPGRVQDFFDINVAGAQNLLEAARESAIRRAVVVSSNSPIGCNPHPDHMFDEESPYHPYMNYGRSKMLMEEAVHAIERRGPMEAVIVRPPWFYGPDQPPRQTLFFSMIKSGKAPIVGGGNNLRSMAYVDNLAQGLLLAAVVPGASGQTYWIADRRPYTMNEIVDTVERLLEQEFGIPVAHKRMRLPGVASEIARLSDSIFQRAGLYNQKIHVLSEMNKTIACSVAKAERELGYRPEVSLEEGMRRSIASCLQRGISI